MTGQTRKNKPTAKWSDCFLPSISLCASFSPSTDWSSLSSTFKQESIHASSGADVKHLQWLKEEGGVYSTHVWLKSGQQTAAVWVLVCESGELGGHHYPLSPFIICYRVLCLACRYGKKTRCRSFHPTSAVWAAVWCLQPCGSCLT